jgi:hypothetical protein
MLLSVLSMNIMSLALCHTSTILENRYLALIIMIIL